MIACVVLALAAAGAAQSPEVTGDWIGTLDTGAAELRIVLHISKSAEGNLKATMDSPDQGVAGLPIDSITLDGAKLRFTISVAKISYEGTVKNSGSISGNWSQVKKASLDFKRTTKPPTLEHPPAPPSDIDGTWEGSLDAPRGKLAVLFHLKNTADGLTATMDSPDQNVKGWPATSVTRKGSSIIIEMKQLEGKFRGEISKDLNRMNGDWSQEEANSPLALKRAKEETPAPPAKN